MDCRNYYSVKETDSNVVFSKNVFKEVLKFKINII